MELQRIEEYEVPSHFTLEEIKARVKGWLDTIVGRDYRLKVLSERNITLTKERHDLKVCGVSCVISCLAPFLLIPLMFGSVQGILIGIGGMILLIGITMAAGIGYYCLKPQRVIFTLRFTDDQPIRVVVSGEGVLIKARGDYENLKSTILRDRDSNDGIGIW